MVPSATVEKRDPALPARIDVGIERGWGATWDKGHPDGCSNDGIGVVDGGGHGNRPCVDETGLVELTLLKRQVRPSHSIEVPSKDRTLADDLARGVDTPGGTWTEIAECVSGGCVDKLGDKQRTQKGRSPDSGMFSGSGDLSSWIGSRRHFQESTRGWRTPPLIESHISPQS